MKNDLISRDALLEKAVFMTQYDEGGWDLDLKAVPVDEVENAPAVDAVEVVRCKDCKHTRGRTEYERNYLVEGVLICRSSDATDDCWNPVWPEHFCSYGERRADDGR